MFQLFKYGLVTLTIVSFNPALCYYDPCKALTNKTIVSYDLALDCYDSFPLDESIKMKTIDTVRKTLQNYAFLDIIQKSPTPEIPYSIDIDKGLIDILNNKYSNERQFQISLTKFLNSLHDGHTRYSSNCFSQFAFYQPFPIYIQNTIYGDKDVVKVVKDLKHSNERLDFWKALGLDVNKYKGSTVLKINGKDPIEYLKEYTDTYVGLSKDINSRINYSLARSVQKNGKWGINYGSFGSTSIPPTKGSIDFTFESRGGSINIRAPYIVVIPSNITDGLSYYQKYCQLEVETKKKNFLSQRKIVHIEKEVMEIEELQNQEITVIPSRFRSFNPLEFPIVKGLYVNTYLLEGNTGVMAISTFNAKPSQTFFDEVKDGFSALKNKGADKLVLDLSNNGGGYICWGYYILDYLFPNASEKYFNTDMHSTPIIKALSKNYEADFFSPLDYNQPDGQPFENEDAFDKILNYSRGLNSKSRYTPLFQDKCDYSFLEDLKNGTQPFATENIAVISNSICYSTCTLLTNGLQEIHKVKSYAFGGLSGTQATTASLAGGTVFSLDSFLQSLKNVEMTNDEKAPKPFPTRATLRFTIREAYSKRFKELRPLEYTWNQANYHIPYTKDTAFNPYKVWEQVAKDFSPRQGYNE